MKIVWTRRANRHLRNAYEYWAHEQSVDAAERMLERIFAVVELLPNHCGIGREGRVPGTRELVLRPTPFLIAYRVHRRKIEIVALVHGSRKWPEQL